ncbi:MAG: hypothetical protein E7386_08590 [Ruminococcaceae bacterium]|nr:hypothetical protein [Oscillospiraceae bacterium]
MKISPLKDYKKPLYAIGIAAAIAATALTGCGEVEYAGTADTKPTESQVELSGDVAMVPEETTSETEKPLITAGIVSNNID